MINKYKIAFLLNSKDIHSVDWYKCALKTLPSEDLYVITDITDEGSLNGIYIPEGHYIKLCPLNRFLLFKDSKLGNIWRNVLKIIALPLQVLKLRQFDKKHPDVRYHAVAMYYLMLARLAKLKYVGTPIGSELLVRPSRSFFYRIFAKKALRGATFVTVDSPSMVEASITVSGVTPHIVQNGIDVKSIQEFLGSNDNLERTNDFLSVRSLDYLYRIESIIKGRNNSVIYKDIPISFIYPFYNESCLEGCKALSKENDNFYGRLDRENMYSLIASSKIVFSIPESDSSPRSVYEAIFLGCAVIITANKYIDILPECMRERLVVADINQEEWFDEAVKKAMAIITVPFQPNSEAIELFDQDQSFKKINKLIDKL